MGDQIVVTPASVQRVDLTPGGSPTVDLTLPPAIKCIIGEVSTTISAGLVPPGGASGDVLTKTSAADYAIGWLPGGGGDEAAIAALRFLADQNRAAIDALDVPVEVGEWRNATASDSSKYGLYPSSTGLFTDADFSIFEEFTMGTFWVFFRVPKGATTIGVGYATFSDYAGTIREGEVGPHGSRYLAPVSPPSDADAHADYYQLKVRGNDEPVVLLRGDGLGSWRLMLAPVTWEGLATVRFWQDGTASPNLLATASMVEIRVGELTPITFPAREARPRYLHFGVPSKYEIETLTVSGLASLDNFVTTTQHQVVMYHSAKTKSRVAITCLIRLVRS